MKLEGKNILLTGGSLGIGKETALNLLRKGANIIVTGRSIDRLKKSFDGTDAKLIEFDIGDIDNIKSNTKKCLEFFNNKVDVLINNAGIGVRRSIEE